VPDSPGLFIVVPCSICLNFSGSRHTKILPKYCVPVAGFEPRSPCCKTNALPVTPLQLLDSKQLFVKY
jgi:hypothetical protein